MLKKETILSFKSLLESDFLNLLQEYKKEYNDFFFNMSIDRKKYDFGYFPLNYDFNHFKLNNFFTDKDINKFIKIVYTQINDKNFNIKVCFELNELLSIKFENTLSILIFEKNISFEDSCINNNHYVFKNCCLEDSIINVLKKDIIQNNIKENFDIMVEKYQKSKNIDWKQEIKKYSNLPVFNRKDYNSFLIETKIIRYLNKKSFNHFQKVN